MQSTSLSYAATGKFSQLVTDYLDGDSFLSTYISAPATSSEVNNHLKIRENYSQENREILTDALLKQYAHVFETEDAHDVKDQIEALRQENTFTITTGHQLCLFTGPLFSVYKILHTIKLAQEIQQANPDKKIIPVFWMASEDHDFEEVNHAYFNEKKLAWRSSYGGAVGRMSTSEIENSVAELCNLLPESENASRILEDLRTAYCSGKNLAEATRTLVHRWFGKYNLVIVDGDDAALKSLMIPAFKREILENTSFNEVEKTNAELQQTYKIQVNPRIINLFFLTKNARSRIVKTSTGYGTTDGKQSWSETEIIQHLNARPADFSPNVILRPLYQETILPNLAYIGGGGEVAYWAQLKSMFLAFDVPFPVVVLRQSILLEPKALYRIRKKLDVALEDLFLPFDKLSKKVVQGQMAFDALIKSNQNKVSSIFEDVEQVAKGVDSSLIKHIAAQKQKALNSLERIEKKLIRAEKKKENIQLERVARWQKQLLPNGGLQERRENIIPQFLEFGPNVLDEILAAIDPLAHKFIVLSKT